MDEKTKKENPFNIRTGIDTIRQHKKDLEGAVSEATGIKPTDIAQGYVRR